MEYLENTIPDFESLLVNPPDGYDFLGGSFVNTQ
jgi:hypothetical protein